MRSHTTRFSFPKSVFKKVSSKSLIYNTSWEDSAIDLQALKLDSDSRVLTIAGAGDNALNYLLANPSSVTAIDQNAYQVALLSIKAELISRGEYDLLRSLFMQGGANAELLSDLRAIVSEMAVGHNAFYQDKLVNLFSMGRSFYYRGSSGFVARMIREKAINKSLAKSFEDYFESTDISTQSQIYLERIEPNIFNKKMLKYLTSASVMSLLGVPQLQLASIREKYVDGLVGFLKEKVRIVFTTLPARENYFWQVYFYGEYVYSRPPYLMEENFELLQNNIGKLEVLQGDLYNTAYSSESKSLGNGFTHANLLDSLDWFSDNARNTIAFPRITKSMADKGLLLFRSAHFDLNSLFEANKNQCSFQSSEPSQIITQADIPRVDNDTTTSQTKKLAINLADLHKKDRVGTYSTLNLAQMR